MPKFNGLILMLWTRYVQFHEGKFPYSEAPKPLRSERIIMPLIRAFKRGSYFCFDRVVGRYQVMSGCNLGKTASIGWAQLVDDY